MITLAITNKDGGRAGSLKESDFYPVLQWLIMAGKKS
jgi:hypothetical protein